MLNKIFLRIENYLIIATALVGYSFAIFFPDNYCNVLLFGGHFLISHMEATISWTIVLFIPFIMHYALRKRKKGDSTILASHVIITLLIIFAFPFLFNTAPLILDEWHHLTVPPPMFDQWQDINYYATLMMIALILIQVLFFLYGFIALFTNDNKPSSSGPIE
ncbi:hypothetical protein GALL_171930 [mine drainage metagenome]|uniref:Uncharacterized protein n=1 Tax=mine drainage metagenome TaxID=410659 RepID=A0A1J5SG37_9ZZZZ